MTDMMFIIRFNQLNNGLITQPYIVNWHFFFSKLIDWLGLDEDPTEVAQLKQVDGSSA